MKRLLVAVALTLALAASVSAQMINTSVIHTDARGLWIGNTFTVNEGAWVNDKRYYTSRSDTCLADTLVINPTSPSPGWLILEIPPEAALVCGWVQFYEPVTGNDLPLTYALGDTMPFYIGGLYREKVFNIGLWDYARINLVGSAAGFADLYWRVECYGN